MQSKNTICVKKNNNNLHKSMITNVIKSHSYVIHATNMLSEFWLQDIKSWNVNKINNEKFVSLLINYH